MSAGPWWVAGSAFLTAALVINGSTGQAVGTAVGGAAGCFIAFLAKSWSGD